MNTSVTSTDLLPHVVTELNYLASMAEKPVNYAFDPPLGVPRSNASYEAHTVLIRDARPVRENLSLDVESGGGLDALLRRIDAEPARLVKGGIPHG